MRVKIGKYLNWVGPYQIAEMILFFVPKKKDEWGIPHNADVVHEFGRWLAEDRNGKDSWLAKACQWIHDRRKRTVKIRIDGYDVWNMNDTLAMIILPMLIELQKCKNGAPYTDDADVPEELRSTSAPPKENEYDTDENHFKRWDWILGEIIWAFTQMNLDDNGEDQFRSGNHHVLFQAVDADHNPLGEPQELRSREKPEGAVLYQMVDAPDNTFKTDYEGLKAHWERIQNGTRLFGRYYNHLWD